MKIYISGPITGTTGYQERFAEAEEKIYAAGNIPVNPERVNRQLPEQTTHEEYMQTSIAMLDMCDVILMLPGWQESKGCNIEFEYAYEHGIHIVFAGGRGSE